MLRPLILVAVLFLAACPTYDDSLSGTFREIPPSSGFVDEARSLEVFRYGDNVQALLRFHKIGIEPFAAETRCVWTSSALFDDEEEPFDLPLVDPRQRLNLRTVFADEDTLNVTISSGQAEAETTRFERFSSRPDEQCTTISDTLMTANFDFEGNTFEPDGFQMSHPVFVVLWMGIEVIEREGIVTLAGTESEGSWRRLNEEHVTSDNRGLKGNIYFYVSPPDDLVLTTSGDTRYTLGHFTVVDDSESQSEDKIFRYDSNVEPMVATAMRLGSGAGGPPDHNMFGRALLFIEGDLTDLDDGLLARMKNIEFVRNPEQHFYVVDVYARGTDVQEIHFPKDPTVELAVTVKTDFLNANSNRLPRLIPFTQ